MPNTIEGIAIPRTKSLPILHPSHSKDDLSLLTTSKTKAKGSKEDLRLLYRNWRTGSPFGADLSSIDKPQDFLYHKVEEELVSVSSGNSDYSYRSSHQSMASGIGIKNNSFDNDTFTIGSPDLSVLSGIPEQKFPSARRNSNSSSNHPLYYEQSNDREYRQRLLSDMFRNESSGDLKMKQLSASLDKQFYGPNTHHTKVNININIQNFEGTKMPKAMSYTGLSDLEKNSYFPSMPKVKASGVQRGLKDSVMNDMCNAVAKQMVGDLYVSSRKQGKKVVNHLYEPVLESVKNHFRRLPARYALSVNPDDVPMHMRLLGKQERANSGIAIHAQHCRNEDGSINPDICDVVVVANDQDNLLDAITRSLTQLKGNILDADVMTTTTGITLDRFVVRGNFVSENILRELKTQIETALGFDQARQLKDAEHEKTTLDFAKQLGVDRMIGSHSNLSTDWSVDIKEVQLELPIGSGRSGQTYSARWRGTRVAAKVINLNQNVQDMTLSEDILNEFYREMALVCKLRHPNIVLFLGAAICPPTYCLLFEYMENGNLSNLIRARKVTIDFFRISREIALGMNYLHLCSIIHRDLKSGNILLDVHGTAKVSDFGLSCVYELEKASDMTAETGTYRWMAPEVIRHEPYTNKADVYSFGIVLWEMIAKEQPFKGMTPIQAAFAVARQQMRPALPSYTPLKLGELVEHCWHQDPIMRPTFAEILEVLPLIKASLKKREFSILSFINS